MTILTSLESVDFDRISKIEDYRKFKKAVRALRDQGLIVEVNGVQSYSVSTMDQVHKHIVRWAFAADPPPAREKEPKAKKEPKEPKEPKAKKERKAKAASQVTRLMTRDEALAALDQAGPLTPLVVNPPVGTTFQAQGWDVITLMSEGCGDLATTMLEAYQYQFPTARADNTRFLLFRDSPNGTPLAQPILAVDFRDEESYHAARGAVDSLAALAA